MILLLDTSTPTCKVCFVVGENMSCGEWQADRQLADGLLGYLQTELEKRQSSFRDVSGLGVFRGPGSFTGLRIGMTVLNTLSDSLQIPIVGETGDDWQKKAIDRLKSGENDKLVLPEYGRGANITQPKK